MRYVVLKSMSLFVGPDPNTRDPVTQVLVDDTVDEIAGSTQDWVHVRLVEGQEGFLPREDLSQADDAVDLEEHSEGSLVSLAESSALASGFDATGAAAATGEIRLSAARAAVDLNATPEVQQLVAVLGEASKSLPDGFRVVVTSTLRLGARVAGSGGRSHHDKGDAIDIQIMNPAGRAIRNSGTDDTGLYKRLAIAAFHANERMFPEHSGELAWGGNFTTGPRDGPPDLMHFDYGGDRGRFGRLAQQAAESGARPA
jgi:hypothetical protein